ncbi:winged helix DNA-binding domain-containing protein [Atractiella rhizophila]|nr:winged helix DNA-binding domain-containing protein [Atractiella rhizophila]
MTKGVRSQFLVKLHDLLENPAHVDGFRWTSETTFQIVANDKLAVAALQPAWKFTNLSSFIRQLNYYGFERMSDRRRSAERNGTSFNAGWIIFTHPSGFFRQGRPDLLDQIVRKSRKGKPEAARPQRSSVVAKVVRTGPTPPSPPISPTTSISSLSSGNSHNSYSSSSSSPSSLEFSKPPMYIGAPDGSLAARRGMDGKASLADYASHAPYGHQFIFPSQYPNYYTGYYGYSPTAASFNHSGETNSPTLTQEFIPSSRIRLLLGTPPLLISILNRWNILILLPPCSTKGVTMPMK